MELPLPLCCFVLPFSSLPCSDCDLNSNGVMEFPEFVKCLKTVRTLSRVPLTPCPHYPWDILRVVCCLVRG